MVKGYVITLYIFRFNQKLAYEYFNEIKSTLHIMCSCRNPIVPNVFHVTTPKRCVCYATISHERSVSTEHAASEQHFNFSHERGIVAIAVTFITTENGSYTTSRNVYIYFKLCHLETYLHCYHYRLPTQCHTRPKWLKTETASSLGMFNFYWHLCTFVL